MDYSNQNQRDTTLDLDLNDPLNLLLHNNSQDSSMDDNSSSNSHESPLHWSAFSSTMWPQQNQNGGENVKYPDMGALDFLQHMDLDFNQSMVVDPNALHFNTHAFDPNVGVFDMSAYQNDQVTNELLSAQFPFTLGSDSFFTGQNKERRLSVTSSSESSSGASLSPVMEHPPQSIPTPAPAQTPVNDPAEELALRVRQAAGVMMAVSAGIQPQQAQPAQSAKLPIPRLPAQPKPTNVKSTAPKRTSTAASSATSSPSPGSLAEDVAASNSGTSATPNAPRPKTSHTTIERRYRTNLNARIQSLRNAVPALRVLEEKGKKDLGMEVDERGFVDGVKVARKGSKANVLGKAVEYIRVLKKREARLKREQSGLRSLIGGLVGGPALLKEWEHEWREKFGGEEKDEIEGDEAEPMSEDEEEEEGEDGQDDDGRAKKKAKVMKVPKAPVSVPKKAAVASAPLVDASGAIIVPEKRKRGRPRKIPVVPPPAQSSPEVMPPGEFTMQQPMVQDPHQQVQQPAQQYLLAIFALFSFFNSPLTSTAPQSPVHPHVHSGSVLGHTLHNQAAVIPNVDAYGWRELVQLFHLAVSALVFFSIVLPWLPQSFKRSPLALSFLSPFSANITHSSKSEKESTLQNSVSAPTLLDALAYERRGTHNEAEHLRTALGVPSGILGLFMGWRRSTSTSLEKRGLEQRAWVRLGELVALDSDGKTSTTTRLQTYWCMRSHISWFRASTSDLVTLALILRPLSSAKAQALWGSAAKTDLVRPFERLVLESLTLDEAAEWLARHNRTVEYAKQNPIGTLATLLIHKRLLKHVSALFVRTVLPDHSRTRGAEDDWVYAEIDNTEDMKLKETIDAGKSLGGRIRELAEALEKVWSSGIGDIDDVLDSNDANHGEVEGEIRSLLSALMLYRQVFPSSILNCVRASAESVSFILSPSSPPRKNPELLYSLRMALGSPVFEYTGGGTDEGQNDDERLGIALEDARDRVIDMLVDGERAGRGKMNREC